MEISRTFGRFVLSILVCISCIGFVLADNIQVSPEQIVLNSQGNYEDILVIIRKAMPSSYRIIGFQLTLFFNEVEVAKAFALRYCVVDQNFLASFDREAIQQNPLLPSMVGTVTARLDGTYQAQNDQGDIYEDTLSGQYQIELLDPDWQMTITHDSTSPAPDDVLIGFDTEDQGSQNWLLWDRGQGSEASFGQTFRFDEPVRLDKITLKIKTTGVDISDKAVELWFGKAYHHVTDTHLTSLIITPTEKLPVTLSVNNTWYVTFDFEDQYLLADTDYGFWLRFASGSSGQGQGLEAYAGAMGNYSYDNGAAFIFNGNWSSTILNNELVFFLHGEQLSLSPLLGDTNIDYKINMLDFCIIAANWLGDYFPMCCGPDISCDGQVNMDDLQYLAGRWLESLHEL